MKQFIHPDFLLESPTARRLFHEYSEHQPIIDFHCHLSPAQIAENKQFENLTEAWLAGDHYKWRAMRLNGVSETYCTGKADPKDKFMKWAETVMAAPGNPLYHWTHLELTRYFGITELLSPSNALRIYEEAGKLLKSDGFRVQELLLKMKVEVVCTTDDPADSLEHHISLKGTSPLIILPTFRPDNAIKIEDPQKYISYLNQLGASADTEIKDFNTLIEALDKRHSYFHASGCRLSDHGLDRFYFDTWTEKETDRILANLLSGKSPSFDEAEKFKCAILTMLCRLNHKRGWTQQIHVGAIRNNNLRLFRQLGPDTGLDSIGAVQDPYKMSRFLSALDETDQLGKTILYNLNPADNEMMITMAGNFNDGSVPGKVQYGAAWWFLDQKTGMEKHLRDLSSLGLLRRFIGMVTDSRSFLSYPRHEYFRRILCNYLGQEVENGSLPDNDDLLRPIVEGTSYTNARDYFGFGNN